MAVFQSAWEIPAAGARGGPCRHAPPLSGRRCSL